MQEEAAEQLFRVPSAAEAMPMPPLPTPRELAEWERHPVTLAYLRLLQWEVYDGIRNANSEIDIAQARGIGHAIEIQVALRDTILKNQPKGEEGEDGND